MGGPDGEEIVACDRSSATMISPIISCTQSCQIVCHLLCDLLHHPTQLTVIWSISSSYPVVFYMICLIILPSCQSCDPSHHPTQLYVNYLIILPSFLRCDLPHHPTQSSVIWSASSSCSFFQICHVICLIILPSCLTCDLPHHPTQLSVMWSASSSCPVVQLCHVICLIILPSCLTCDLPHHPAQLSIYTMWPASTFLLHCLLLREGLNFCFLLALWSGYLRHRSSYVRTPRHGQPPVSWAVVWRPQSLSLPTIQAPSLASCVYL